MTTKPTAVREPEAAAKPRISRLQRLEYAADRERQRIAQREAAKAARSNFKTAAAEAVRAICDGDWARCSVALMRANDILTEARDDG